MANQEHVKILKQGVEVWNHWRKAYPNIRPDLSGENLRGAKLGGAILTMAKLDRANLNYADLHYANLRGASLLHAHLHRAGLTHAYLGEAILASADLSEANLTDVELIGADLSKANLEGARLVKTNLEGAVLSGCRVYGVATWDIQGEPKGQSDLIITRSSEANITVDDLEIAQFIYLILNRQKLRRVLNAVMEKGVLILGRFGGGGLEVLRSIAAKLKEMNYIPIIFDFKRPKGRNYTEIVKTLAGLSRFVIVDLSGPSVPQELYATVPHYRIPFVPIIEKGRREYSMFVDLLERDNVLKPIVEFASTDELIKMLPEKIIDPAEEKHRERQALLEQLFINR